MVAARTARNAELVPLKTVTAPISTVLPFWKKLSPEDQRKVTNECGLVQQNIISSAVSQLRVGQHLLEVRKILEKYEARYFVKTVRAMAKTMPKKLSLRTAYRYMDDFEKLNSFLPDHVMPAALARFDSRKEVEVLPRALKQLPNPPGPSNAELVPNWLDRLEDEVDKLKNRAMARERAKEGEYANPEELLRMAYRFVSPRLVRLPEDGRTRKNFVRRFAGMLLSDLDQPALTTVEPVAVPSDYRVVRGRPPKNRDEESEVAASA